MQEIDISVKNYGGISQADVTMRGITFLMGVNGAGKSTIARAAASCLKQNLLPIPETTKKGSFVYVKANNASGSIKLKTADGSVTIPYPEPRLDAKGKLPQCSAYAVGIDSLLDQGTKERATTLLDYIQSEVTEKEFKDAMAEADVPAEKTQAVWDYASVHGFDAAFQASKDKGTKYKGAWEEITGDNYGSDKAETWLPEKWDKTLRQTTAEALDAELEAAEKAYEEEKIAACVTESQLEEARQLAPKWELIVAAYAEAEAFQKKATIALQDARLKLNELTDHKSAAYVGVNGRCPKCDQAIKYDKGKFIIWEDAKPVEELDVLAAAREAVKIAEAERDAAIVNFTDIADQSRKIKRAKDILEQWSEKQLTGEDGKLQELEAAVYIASDRCKSFRIKQKADEKHALVKETLAICKLLAPEGLRKKKLGESLKDFNARLAEQCEIAAWPVIKIEDDLDIRYDGRSYPLLSSGEKTRVRIVLQILQAKIDKSEALIIDCTDYLDPAGKNGILKLLTAAQLPALVTLIARKEEAEKYARKVTVYWLEKGEATCLSQQLTTA